MKYRSGLERTFHQKFGSCTYEKNKLSYIVTHTYTPDFCLAPNKYVETKGLFSGSDRNKHLYIKSQHPEVRVLFVFQNPKLKLSKKSKTSYSDWCDKNGFKWMSINEIGAYTHKQLIDLLST